MKQVLLLLLLFVSIKGFACVNNNISQNAWRWRNNDGNESSATWKAGQTTPAIYNINQGVIRLRMEMINNYGSVSSNSICVPASYFLLDSLQYTTDTANSNSWKSISNNLSGAFVMAGANVFVAQNTPTTPQINVANNTFSSGRVIVSDNVTNFIISASGRTEVEWAIVGTPNMLLNTTYFFRQYRSPSQVRRYISYPTLATTSPPLPVKLTRFTVKGEGNKARIEWETTTEQNNDRFEVQRSLDQSIWQTVATVKGKGSSTTPVSYIAYDDHPVSGISYYRLQQFDKDRKSTFSEIQILRMAGSSRYAVFPNPVHDAIKFINTGTVAENITATLSDASGKIMHRQRFSYVQGRTVSTLNLVTPPPGIYLLQITGSNASETMKLIIR